MDENVNLDVEIKEVTAEQEKKDEGHPLSLGSYLRLNLSDEKMESVVKNILDEISDILTNRKSLEEKIGEYRNQYDQIVEETSMPFPGCFNLNVPITAKNVDACVAQAEEAFEDVDPKWMIQTPPNRELISARDIQEKILDYYEDTEMSESEAWTKVYNDAFLLGNGWLAMVFKRDFIRVRDYAEFSSLEQFVSEYPNDYVKYPKQIEKLARGETVKFTIDKNQEVCRSAKPEHVEWEDVIVPLMTNGLEGMLKTRLVARRVMMRWEEIYNLEVNGDYIAGTSKKLKMKLDKDGNISDDDFDPDYLKKVFETFEVRYFVDIDGDELEEACLFNIAMEHKLCLRAIRYPYDHNRPYLTPFYIQCTRKGIYQPGLGEKLQPLNIALNAIINHVLNASIIANSLSLKVRSGSDAVKALYEHQWYPGAILELMNVDDVQQFTFNTPNLSGLINLFAIVEKFGQDVSGIVNYVLGQESGDDPQAPASKTIALMRKSELKLRQYIKNLKRSSNEVGYQALRLINQYIPKSRMAEILGVPEEQVTNVFQYPLKAITQSSGFAIEKMFEQRDDMNMFQRLSTEPLFMGDPKRRMIGWRVMAKDVGSNWDKKIELLLPTAEEIAKQEAQAQAQKDQKKSDAIKQVVNHVLENGGSPEEARQAGLEAGKNLDQMMIQQSQQVQQQDQKGGPSNKNVPLPGSPQ